MGPGVYPQKLGIEAGIPGPGHTLKSPGEHFLKYVPTAQQSSGLGILRHS